MSEIMNKENKITEYHYWVSAAAFYNGGSADCAINYTTDREFNSKSIEDCSNLMKESIAKKYNIDPNNIVVIIKFFGLLRD